MQNRSSHLPLRADGTLYVLDIGRGDPVVLLHGLGSSHRDFEAQIAALSARHRVLAVDLRGHGRSPDAEQGISVSDLALDVARLLECRGLDACHIVGWSLGGLVGAVLAHERPELVRSLVLINSPPRTKPSTLAERVRWMERRLLTRWISLPRLGALIARRLFVGSEHEALRREFVERFATNDPKSYQAVFDAIRMHDDGGLLEAIRCPVLVIAGDRDYWPVAAKAAQCARFAEARLKVIRDSGHATPVERPAEVNALLLRFFQNPSSDTPGATRSARQALGAALAMLALSACSGADDGAGAAHEENGAALPHSTAVTSAEPLPAALNADAGAVVPSRPDGDAAAIPSPDAAPPPIPPADALVAPSRCRVTETTVFCEHNVTPFAAGTAIRNVYWQTPAVPTPSEGYPVVLVYQGSLFGPALTWGELTAGVPFGGFHQGRLQAMLLDRGFTVIAPEAAGGVAWQTNSGVPYEATTDHVFIEALLAAISDGEFGPADPDRMYATGISSGGYMTSRMAVSYPGVFRALAVQSASYATCLGPICSVPATLPADHPPTLLLHGAADTTVPVFTAEAYHDALVASGIETELIVDAAAGHEWLADSPERISNWFLAH